MKTMIRDPANDYDIDDGVYFRKEDLVGGRGAEMTSLQARQMVRDAVDYGRFKQAPEVRSNCVRVFYEAGYHVDLPVYRRVETSTIFGDDVRYELAASTGWKSSDARNVSDWYENERDRSADGQQLRRINRDLKKYARSRHSWRAGMLSGFGISVLLVERFRHSRSRGLRSLRDHGSDSRPTCLGSPGRAPGHDRRLHYGRVRRRAGAGLPRQAERRDRLVATAVPGRLHPRAKRSGAGTRSLPRPSSASGSRMSSAPRRERRRSLARGRSCRRPRLRRPRSAALAVAAMPETAFPLPWRQAALRLEARLRELTGRPPERLDSQVIATCYPCRPYVAGWRVSVTFTDGKVRRIDVVATGGSSDFPGPDRPG